MAKILVVEDDKDLNNAYRIILESKKHEVESVYNGSDALKKLSSFQPQLVLLDMLMPIKSGLEFLRDAQVTTNYPKTRILVFTNLEKGPEIDEALKLGADRYVVKSWAGPQGLLTIVEDILSSSGQAKAVAN